MQDRCHDHHFSSPVGARRKEAPGLCPMPHPHSTVHRTPHQAQGPPRGGLPSASQGPPRGLLRQPGGGQTLPLSSLTSFLLLISIKKIFFPTFRNHYRFLRGCKQKNNRTGALAPPTPTGRTCTQLTSPLNTRAGKRRCYDAQLSGPPGCVSGKPSRCVGSRPTAAVPAAPFPTALTPHPRSSTRHGKPGPRPLQGCPRAPAVSPGSARLV